jgi:hypothetical protein
VPFGLPLSYDQWIYLLSLGVLVALFVGRIEPAGGRIGARASRSATTRWRRQRWESTRPATRR